MYCNCNNCMKRSYTRLSQAVIWLTKKSSFLKRLIDLNPASASQTNISNVILKGGAHSNMQKHHFSFHSTQFVQ